jgi:hypothetical protein
LTLGKSGDQHDIQGNQGLWDQVEGDFRLMWIADILGPKDNSDYNEHLKSTYYEKMEPAANQSKMVQLLNGSFLYSLLWDVQLHGRFVIVTDGSSEGLQCDKFTWLHNSFFCGRLQRAQPVSNLPSIWVVFCCPRIESRSVLWRVAYCY